jgi:hypothetical protein
VSAAALVRHVADGARRTVALAVKWPSPITTAAGYLCASGGSTCVLDRWPLLCILTLLKQTWPDFLPRPCWRPAASCTVSFRLSTTKRKNCGPSTWPFGGNTAPTILSCRFKSMPWIVGPLFISAQHIERELLLDMSYTHPLLQPTDLVCLVRCFCHWFCAM